MCRNYKHLQCGDAQQDRSDLPELGYAIICIACEKLMEFELLEGPPAIFTR